MEIEAVILDDVRAARKRNDKWQNHLFDSEIRVNLREMSISFGSADFFSIYKVEVYFVCLIF